MTSQVRVVKLQRFGDIKLEWDGCLKDPQEAISLIGQKMPEWVEEDVPSIWISLKGKDLDHLNKFIDIGFTMHRIDNSSELVINKWLRTKVHNLPPGPFGYFGIGALCFNHEGKILSVRENYKTGPGTWKLPGGLYDRSKDVTLSDGAVRECFEETGIRSKFQCILMERFAPNSSMFGYCDLYSICRVEAITEDIHYDPIEIADCKWLDLSEFYAGCLPIVKTFVESSLKSQKGVIETNIDSKSIIYTSAE